MADHPTKIAILGAGIFVKTEYIPRLAEIPHLFTLTSIWSRTEESAKGAVEIAKEFFPDVECKWGDAGLEEIVQDSSIVAVLVVLAAQFQVDLSLRLLKAGKHVLQEKPAAASMSEVENAISSYNSLPSRPIWGIAENYRFELAFKEGRRLMAVIGDMVNFQIIVEVPMNSSSPYFSTSWRHKNYGGYILDMGVHFIAALRVIAGCGIHSVSAVTSHVDLTLPPPDSISSAIQLENGCPGVFVTVISGKTLKLFWRIVGLKGTLQIEALIREGKYGYEVTLYTADGETNTSFIPSCGVVEELKAFLNDVSVANQKKDDNYQAEPRLSFLEGAQDFAVLDAMLQSGQNKGTLMQVKRF